MQNNRIAICSKNWGVLRGENKQTIEDLPYGRFKSFYQQKMDEKW